MRRLRSEWPYPAITFLDRVEPALIGEDFGQGVEAIDVEGALGAFGGDLDSETDGLLRRDKFRNIRLVRLRPELLALRFRQQEPKVDALGGGALAGFRIHDGTRQEGFGRGVAFGFEETLALRSVPSPVHGPGFDPTRKTTPRLPDSADHPK